MTQIQYNPNCSLCGNVTCGCVYPDDNSYCYSCRSLMLKLDNIEKECRLLQSKLTFDFNNGVGFTEKHYISELNRLYELREIHNDDIMLRGSSERDYKHSNS